MRDRWLAREWSQNSDRILRIELMAAIKKLKRKKRKARKKKDE